MRAWKTAPVRIFCGYCRAAIQQGDPYLAITFAEVKHEKRRCRECAGEPVHGLDSVVRQPKPSFSKPMALVGKVLADVRAMEAGQFSREVGEDDD